MNRTRIDWTDFSWNPVTGCSRLCDYCYARRMAHRFHRSFEPTCHPERLQEPLKLKAPSRIFVDSAGDLFDPAIPPAFIGQVLNIIGSTPWHTYIILTKQAERMAEIVSGFYSASADFVHPSWRPLPNAWLGVTVEHQGVVNRLSWLAQTPAAVRFISVEPMLGPVVPWRGLVIPDDDDVWDEVRCEDNDEPEEFIEECEAECDWINYGHDLVVNPRYREWERVRYEQAQWCTFRDTVGWVVIGGENGPSARECKPEWAAWLIRDCKEMGVPVFVKGALSQRFRIQEFPKEVAL